MPIPWTTLSADEKKLGVIFFNGSKNVAIKPPPRFEFDLDTMPAITALAGGQNLVRRILSRLA
jgi:hypothetical protein